MRRALLLLLVMAAQPAFAEDPKPKTEHKEGEYGGITPGQPPPADRPAKPKRPPPKGTLTWIGFEAKDGGAQLFFQSVAAFDVSQRLEGSTLVVHLSLTRLGRQTWRQIDTRFFDNPLSYVRAGAVRAVRATKTRAGHGAGIDVRITFKNPKDAKQGTVRNATEADGMSYAYVTFPEGTTDASKPTGTITTEPEQ